MNRFADLLDRLAYEPGRNAKLRLMTGLFPRDAGSGPRLRARGDHRRADVPPRQAGMIRALIAERTDPMLFELSYDYVGDLSETVALMWPAPNRRSPPPGPGAEEPHDADA